MNRNEYGGLNPEMLTFYLSIIESAEEKLLFETIYNECDHAAFKIAMNILKNQHDAEEALQETWMSVAVNLGSIHINDMTYIKSYVIKIANNKALDMLRKRNRTEAAKEDVDPDTVVAAGDSEDNTLYSLCSKESYENILACLNSLSEKYREIMNHYYLNTKNTREIARLTGLREATVRTRLRRGRAKLVEELRKGTKNDGR